MATTTSSALAKLRRRRQNANEAYRKTVSASLNKYGKAVQKSFQEGLVSRANLIAKREDRENKQRVLRERFTAATSNVLSRDTLAMLREHSKIDAPTLTSIFTGYESARADRADRFEKLLDKREEGLERVQAADELAFRDAATQRQQTLTAQGNILNNGMAIEKALFASDSQGIKTEADFANTEIQAQNRAEEARKQREAAAELQRQRDALAERRDAAKFKNQIAVLDKNIAAKKAAAQLAYQKQVALQEQANRYADARAARTDANALARLKQSDADARARAAAKLKADQEAARLKHEFEAERAKTEQQNEIELIEKRGEVSIAEKKTVGGGTTPAPKPFSSSTLNALRSGKLGATTPAPSGEVQVTPTGEIETVDENPVVEGGTEPVAGDVVPLDEQNAYHDEPRNRPLPGKEDESTFGTEMPGTPASPTSATYFDTNIANSEDPEGEARQLISSVLAERGVVELNDLGDDATFEQLAALIDEENEEDERLTSTIAGIRQTRTTEVS